MDIAVKSLATVGRKGTDGHCSGTLTACVLAVGLCILPAFLRAQSGPDEFLVTASQKSSSDRGFSPLDIETGQFGPVTYPEGTKRVLYTMSVSPDGSRIAYSANSVFGSATGMEIRVANRDWTDSKLVVASHPVVIDWSPDGTRLAYLGVSSAGFADKAVRVRSLTGGPPLDLEHPDIHWNAGLAWSPDGSEIAYLTRVPESLPNPYPRSVSWIHFRIELRVWNLATMTTRLICRNVHSIEPNGAYDATHVEEEFAWPRWSPDGTRILVARNCSYTVREVATRPGGTFAPPQPGNIQAISGVDPRPGAEAEFEDIVVCREGFGSESSPKFRLLSPSWSPDGGRIAYTLIKNSTYTPGVDTRAWEPVDGIYAVNSSPRPQLPVLRGTFSELGNLVAPYTSYPNGSATLFQWVNTKPVSVRVEAPRRSFQLGDDFTATVTVALTKPEPWRVSFPDHVLVAERPGVLDVETVVAEPFDLLPTPDGWTRSFTVKVNALDGGLSRLISTIEATAGSETHTISGDARISVCPLLVTVQTKPLVDGKPVLNMKLDPDGTVRDSSGNEVVPKVEVKVKNLGQRAIQTHLQGLDPRKRDRSTALGRIAVDATFPQEFAALAPDETVAREFPLTIHANGRFEFAALVSGTIVGSPEEGFETTKRGAPVAIGERYPMKIEFKPANEVLSQLRPRGGGAFLIPPGDSTAVLAVVSNLTTNATLQFEGISATTFGNALGGTLTSDDGGQTCPIVVSETVDAGSQVVLSGKILSEALGSPSGTLVWELPVEPKLKDDATGVETVLTADDILVETEAGGWGGNDLAMHLIQDHSQPVREPISNWLEAAYFGKGAMVGIGGWFYDSVDFVGALGRVAGDPSGLADAVGEGSRALWEAAELVATTWNAMTPAEREEFILDVAREVQRRAFLRVTTGQPFDRNDFQQVLSFTQSATYPLFNGVEQAYASNDPARIAQLWGSVAGNIAMEAATCFIPTPKFTRYTSGADAARLASNKAEAGLATAQEVFLTRVKSGPVDEAIAQNFWGQGGDELSNFQRVFRAFGVRGYMRERAPECTHLIEELAEAIWKPEAMKPKGLNDTDLLLLGNPPPVVLGKPPGNAPLPLKAITGIFYPESDSVLRARFSGQPPEFIDAIIERAKFRREEYIKYRPKFQQWKKPLAEDGGIPVKFNYADNGAVPPDGSVGAANRAFDYDTVEASNAVDLIIPRMANSSGELRLITGDVDWIHFTFENGLPLDRHTAGRLYKVLQRYGLQHPETISWILNGQSVFAAKISQIGAYLRGQKALLEVSGNALRAVRINPNLTRFVRNGRDHLIFFDGGTKEIKEALKKAEIDNAFAFLIELLPPRPILLPFLWTQRWGGPDDADTSVGGNDWTYSGADDALLVRQLEDGALEQFTNGSWIPWTIPSSPKRNAGTLQLAPLTVTETATAAGATTLPLTAIHEEWADLLAGHLDHWFSVDDLVIIAPGTAREEIRRVTATTPLTVHAPLRFAHPVGTTVAVMPGALALQDPDNDGLDTLTEIHLGTYPNRRDSDGDGAADGEEVQLGTDPLDAMSHFRILSFNVAPDGSALTVVWSSVPGKRYVVETASDLLEWSPSDPINASGTDQTSATLPLNNPGVRHFCRVRLSD
jgi:WD40 repeat protein